ncbi:MAG: UPF0158 family protein [Anaerolineae bacterium]|jgi:hypothetical protein|nr:UPF0158 family protein [Anaerolineae bacterium]
MAEKRRIKVNVLEDWYIFKDDQARQRALDWLGSCDIEMIAS